MHFSILTALGEAGILPLLFPSLMVGSLAGVVRGTASVTCTHSGARHQLSKDCSLVISSFRRAQCSVAAMCEGNGTDKVQFSIAGLNTRTRCCLCLQAKLTGCCFVLRRKFLNSGLRLLLVLGFCQTIKSLETVKSGRHKCGHCRSLSVNNLQFPLT